MEGGLLGKPNPLLSMGIGLLSAAGPHFDPSKATLGHGLFTGMEHYQRSQQAQLQEKLAQAQLSDLYHRRQQEQRATQAQQQQRQAQMQALNQLIASVPAEDATGQMLVNVIRSGNVKEGVQALVQHMNLKPAALPSQLQVFQGYQGMAPEQQAAFRQFRQSGAPQINVGDREAQKFQGQREYLDRVVGERKAAYESAIAAYKEDPTNLGKRRAAANAASAYQTAIAGAENFRGEPSAEVARRFDVAGPGTALLEEFASGFLPGSPEVSPANEGKPAGMSDKDWSDLQRLRSKYGR